VGRVLREDYHLPVLDADKEARMVLASGTQTCRAVLARYGTRVRALSGAGHPHVSELAQTEAAIDRAALARIMFGDAAERAWLEALVHPVVRERLECVLEALALSPIVVLMIPLLFEARMEDLCSEVWLVECSVAKQLERLVTRDGLHQAEAQQRISAQWSMECKHALADRCLSNEGGLSSLQAEVAAHLGANDGPRCLRGA